MVSIAVIGTGISGLACGYLLHRDHDVALFERNGYAGGHTHTVMVREEGRELPVDTGFMVFNEVTYPNLTRLFARLGVATVPTSMSFGVQHVGAGIEYCGSSVSRLFAQRRNLVRPRFLRMLAAVSRFNAEAEAAIDDGRFARMSLEEYARVRRYGRDFLELYLLPMAGAVWSTPFAGVHRFPAVTLLRFFRNHGLLGGLDGHHPWLTVAGGAKTYVEAMTAGFRDRIRLDQGVAAVERDAAGVTLRLGDGSPRRFDKVILACHADEALRLLAAPSAEERRLLSRFRYQENVATLHTDPAPMPRTRRAWASWNVRLDGRHASTIYWMNSLQRVSRARDYFVSIDDPGLVDPAAVLRRIVYHHPLFDVAAVEAQAELPSLLADRTFFCGAYFGYGFHEDGLRSAIAASRAAGEGSVADEEAA